MYDDSFGGGAVLKRAAAGDWMYGDLGGGAILKRAPPSMGGMWNEMYRQRRKLTIKIHLCFIKKIKANQMTNGVNSGVKMHGNDHILVHLDLEAVQMLSVFTNGPFHPHHHQQAILQNTDYPKGQQLTSVPSTLTNFFQLHFKQSGNIGPISGPWISKYNYQTTACTL